MEERGSEEDMCEKEKDSSVQKLVIDGQRVGSLIDLRRFEGMIIYCSLQSEILKVLRVSGPVGVAW